MSSSMTPVCVYSGRHNKAVFEASMSSDETSRDRTGAGNTGLNLLLYAPCRRCFSISIIFDSEMLSTHFHLLTLPSELLTFISDQILTTNCNSLFGICRTFECNAARSLPRRTKNFYDMLPPALHISTWTYSPFPLQNSSVSVRLDEELQ